MKKDSQIYERITMYVSSKKESHDSIKKLELNDRAVDTAEKREIHDAIIEEAISNPDRWIERLDQDDA